MKLTLNQAAQLLKQDDVVAVPTETVYGLAAHIDSLKALKKVFALKGRPADNPLIVHVSSFKQWQSLVKVWPEEQIQALKKFMPGPLTVVLPAKKTKVPYQIRAGLDTVAIRIPKQNDFLSLIRKVGPIAAPSANLSGRPSATQVKHVHHDFGEDFPVVDGGACKAGIESTVIRLVPEGWQLLREGSVSQSKLEKALGSKPLKQDAKSKQKPRTPGQKYKHYSPKARLILAKLSQSRIKKEKVDAILGFSGSSQYGLPFYSLGSIQKPKLALKKLYHMLRQLDLDGHKTVFVTDFKVGDSEELKLLKGRLKKASLKS